MLGEHIQKTLLSTVPAGQATLSSIRSELMEACKRSTSATVTMTSSSAYPGGNDNKQFRDLITLSSTNGATDDKNKALRTIIENPKTKKQECIEIDDDEEPVLGVVGSNIAKPTDRVPKTTSTKQITEETAVAEIKRKSTEKDMDTLEINMERSAETLKVQVDNIVNHLNSADVEPGVVLEIGCLV